MSDIKIPGTYAPFDKVWVCGNTFERGKVILVVEGVPVFLVGRGDRDPFVWLNAPYPNKPKPEWKPIIEQNQIREVGFKIHQSDYGYVVLHEDRLLIEFRVERDVLVISAINLMSVGLNVTGTLRSLIVSGMNLSGNKFVDVTTMVGIGGDGQPI